MKKRRVLLLFFGFFLRGESSFFITDESKSRKKRADVFSLEKEEHTREKSSRTHTDRFCFLRRAAETERAVEKEQFFHLRKSRVFSRESAHKEKSKSLLGNTQTETLTEEKLLLSKKCLHSCRYKYKTIIALFFFCTLRRDALPFALSARSLCTFEEAFVVVVSEEARFCLHSLFLVV